MSAVIKAGDSRLTSRGACTLDLRDISSQAEAILAAARAEAANIIDAARAQAAGDRGQHRESAHREGFEQGLVDGRKQGFESALEEARKAFDLETSGLQSSLMLLIEELSAKRDRLYLAARRDVLILAIALASRICGGLKSLEDEISETAAEACGQALALLSTASKVVVRTHPEDAASIEKISGQFAQTMKSSPHLEVVTDPSVDRGGVIVESAESTIDAGITTRLDRLADELVTSWRERRKALSPEL